MVIYYISLSKHQYIIKELSLQEDEEFAAKFLKRNI